MSEEPDYKAMVADLQSQLEAKDEHLKRVIAERDAISKKCVDNAVQRRFIEEVTTFHREALLPLATLVGSIIGQVKEAATPELQKQLDELHKFTTKVEDRCKHFNSQTLVDKARQAALDEQKRLERVTPAP